MEEIIIYTDGGARGNPGPAGIGVVIMTGSDVKKYGEYLGDNITNNEAEYRAVIFALERLKLLIGKEKSKRASVKIHSDSQLLVRQMNHEYKINGEGIQKFFLKIWNLMLDFGKVEFIHIPREENKQADKLANEAMDQGAAKLF